MITAQRTVPVSGRLAARLVPALPSSHRARTSVVRRFREEAKQDHVAEDMKQVASHNEGQLTDTKLSAEQLEELVKTPAGVISPRRANMGADLGNAASDPALADYAGPLQTPQAFDGPIPETLNGRLCMLAIPIALFEEWQTSNRMLEQVAAHPERIIGITLLIALATYVPAFRGYTRKEPYANKFLGISWSPMAENWNGRLAMLGFVGMIATEAITGVNTLQAWGLQDVYFGIRSAAGL